jgi:thiamine pyrophosphokinase
MSSKIKSILEQCVEISLENNIIIANGEVPADEYLLQILYKAKSIICCDGAINALERYNIIPSYIIGDCDSLSESQKLKYADKIKYVFNQNLNDLSKAVEFAVNELHLSDVIILGATGLREDHSLANIALLLNYAQNIKNVLLISDYGFFCVSSGDNQIRSVARQQISIFAVNNNTHVSTRGLKWDLSKLILNSWHTATLNEATGASFTINSSDAVIVYRAFELK